MRRSGRCLAIAGTALRLVRPTDATQILVPDDELRRFNTLQDRHLSVVYNKLVGDISVVCRGSCFIISDNQSTVCGEFLRLTVGGCALPAKQIGRRRITVFVPPSPGNTDHGIDGNQERLKSRANPWDDTGLTLRAMCREGKSQMGIMIPKTHSAAVIHKYTACSV